MILKCPECGKVYEDVLDVPADKRLAGHLTGKHCLKGDKFWAAMAKALKEFVEKHGRKI